MSKHIGFHQKNERTGFELELEEAMNGYFRSTGYVDIMSVHTPRDPLERKELYDGSEEWYVMMERGETVGDGNDNNKR